MTPRLSPLALGTWRLLNDPVTATPAGALALIRTALDAGIDTIDTAEIYGGYGVEAVLGEALRLDPGVKAKVRIVTKAGIYVPHASAPDRKVAHYNASAQQLVASAETSLRKLGVERLELFLVHRPDWFTAHAETAEGLKQLISSGKVATVGVSNYTTAQWDALSAFLGQAPATNQLQFSPFHLDPMFDGTIDRCQQAGVRPMAWSPTGGGRLFSGTDETSLRVRKCLESLAGKYGVGVDALCHAWVMGHPSHPISVLGTNKAERVASAAKAMSVKLEREDWFAIAEAARGSRIP
jgi:predicted oxidoreductase